MGESDDGTVCEGVRLTVVRSTVTASSGEVKAFDSGRGVNAEGSSVKRWLVLGKVSMSPVEPAATGSGEVPGLSTAV